MIGQTLTQQNLQGFEHDMKHFFSTLIGLFVMIIGTTPDSMSTDNSKIESFAKQFSLMLFYMYLGMFAANIFFNGGKTGIIFCKSVFFTPNNTDITEEQTTLRNSIISL